MTPTIRLSLAAVAMTAALCASGCGGTVQAVQNSSPSPTPAPTVNPAVAAKSIYVQNFGNSPGSLDVYPANLNGTAQPSLQYNVDPSAVAVDSNGTVYVSVMTPSLANVLVFPSGSQVAARTISVPDSHAQNLVRTMEVDTLGNLYVAFSHIIFVLPANANGNTTPLRTIAGPSTTLSDTGSGVTEMAIDKAGYLYVAEGDGYRGSQVVRFDPGAADNVAPTVITSNTYYPRGVALDSAENIYICQDVLYSPLGAGRGTAAIYEFASGTTAGAAPIRTISGTATKLQITHNLHIDAAGNIFVMIYGNGINGFAIFPADAAGDIPPASVLARSHWVSGDSQFAIY